MHIPLNSQGFFGCFSYGLVRNIRHRGTYILSFMNSSGSFLVLLKQSIVKQYWWLQSTKKVLRTPGSDSTEIRWQGILETIPNDITRIGNPPDNVVNEQWRLHNDKEHWIGQRGQTDKFPWKILPKWEGVPRLLSRIVGMTRLPSPQM